MRNDKHSPWLRIYTLVISAIFIFTLPSCSDDDTAIADLLITIKDRQISAEEFIKRAEYTIRPAYCRGESPIDKKIIFNSLVAEKLFALEAGEDNELTRNDEFQTYMLGRLEQSMRQYYYNDNAYIKATVADSEVNQVFAHVGKKYRISYISVNSEEKAKYLADVIEKHPVSLDSIILDLTGSGEIPTREIGYHDPDLDSEIAEVLFSKELANGDKIGPVKTDKNEYVFMEVKGWTKSVSLSSGKQQQDWLDLKEKIKNRKAAEIYQAEVLNLMSGKSVTFNQDNFKTLVNLLGPQYVKESSEMKEELKDKLFLSQKDKEALRNIGNSLDKLANKELLNYSGKVWTFKDFENELAKHPLVFRNPKFKKSQFAEQLKLAIIDMIRDREITSVAYELGYQDKPQVKQNYSMWRDNLLAQYYKNEILKQSPQKNLGTMALIDSVFNPKVQELQKKYSEDIFVDVDLFNDLKLTRIDMIALQKQMPFPIVVPSFPQLTNTHQMNYGKKRTE